MGAKRGFASMDPDKRREIAALGGKAAHEYGAAHEFTREEAQFAGRLGGMKVSQDRSHMSEIGRLGIAVRLEEKRRNECSGRGLLYQMSED